MFLRTATILLMMNLLHLARGNDDDLFVPGVKYFVQNVITGYVFHNPSTGPTSGSAIIGMPIDGAQPDPQLWTLQFVSQGKEEDSGTVYTFNSTVANNVHLFTTGLAGSIVVTKNVTAQFLISPLDDLDGLYTISSPTEAMAVTANTTCGLQLTLQPINPVSPFQQWAFVPFGPVPEDDD